MVASPSKPLTLHTMCPMNCHPTYCGMLVTVQDGKLLEVKGDPTHPDSHGFLCVRGPLYRLMPPVHFDAQGSTALAIDFQDPPQQEARILAGSTWRFQCWFRDPNFGGAGFNATDGLVASFCP